MSVNLSRRGFLLGGSAVAVAAAMPGVVATLPEAAPLYAGEIGEYVGITIRDLQLAKRAMKRASIPPVNGYYLIAPYGSQAAALFKIMPGERRREAGILLIGGENGCG